MAWWSAQARGIKEWQELSTNAFVDLQCRSDAPSFAGTLRHIALDNSSMSWVTTDPLQVRRTPESAMAHRGDRLLLTVQISALSSVEQSGRTAVLTPGAAALYDPRKPYLLNFPIATQKLSVLQINRNDLPFSESDLESLFARTIPPATPGMTTLAGILHGIEQDSTSAAQLADRLLIDVLGLAGDRILQDSARRDQDSRLLSEIKRWLRQRLANESMSSSRIASEFFVSERKLYSLFAAVAQTPAGWLRNERTALARNLLLTTTLAVASIGARCGYPDSSTFVRFFKQATGESPGRFRHRAHRIDEGA